MTTPVRRRGSSPRPAAGRCSPSRPAGRAPARTRSGPTGCCSATRPRRPGRAGRRRRPPDPEPSGHPAAGPHRRRGRRRCVSPGVAAVDRPRPHRVPRGRAAADGRARAATALAPGVARPRRRGRRRASTRSSTARHGLTPHEVAGEVAAALPAGGLLFVGASQPDPRPRPHGAALPGRRPADGRGEPRPRRHRRHRVQSPSGAALGRPRSTRSLALMGDVTFLHDLTGLVIGPDEPRPDLTVVVVNDDGGSIFASLEQGSPGHAGVVRAALRHPARGRPRRALRGAPARRTRGSPTREDAARRRSPDRRGGSRSSRPSYGATTGASSTPRSGRWRGRDRPPGRMTRCTSPSGWSPSS